MLTAGNPLVYASAIDYEDSPASSLVLSLSSSLARPLFLTCDP
jgi:hypothetical protein